MKRAVNLCLGLLCAVSLPAQPKPVVVVIKKNVSTLKNIYAWLKEWNTRESADKIDNIPMLMIDDEADNASINTNREDLDPTATNRELRNILSLFGKSCRSEERRV